MPYINPFNSGENIKITLMLSCTNLALSYAISISWPNALFSVKL